MPTAVAREEGCGRKGAGYCGERKRNMSYRA